MKIGHFTVEGSGPFPWDMLRYDGAWPTTSEDVQKLHGTGRRRIHLSSAQGPTHARWASFGWKVVEDEFVSRFIDKMQSAGEGGSPIFSRGRRPDTKKPVR